MRNAHIRPIEECAAVAVVNCELENSGNRGGEADEVAAIPNRVQAVLHNMGLLIKTAETGRRSDLYIRIRLSRKYDTISCAKALGSIENNNKRPRHFGYLENINTAWSFIISEALLQFFVATTRIPRKESLQ
jgi:hypothetical protein